MTDADVTKGEDAKLQKARWEKLGHAIRQEWARKSYDPLGHFNGITAAGDPEVFFLFRAFSRGSYGSKPVFADYLADRDTKDVQRALYRQQQRERTA